MKTKTIWYKYLSELQDDYPELSDEQLYNIDNFRVVTINDNRFGKDNVRINKPYFVEVPTKYGFEESNKNIYDDLISDEIRKYIPNHVIRAVDNAVYDGKHYDQHQVEFRYLPLRDKNIENQVFDPILIKILKIGNWVIFRNDRFVADLGTPELKLLAKKYDVYEQSLWQVADHLRYYSLIIKEDKRNLKSLDSTIRKILTSYANEIDKRIKNGDYNDEIIGESKEELEDIVISAYNLRKEKIEIEVEYGYEQWRQGYIHFSSKKEAIKFINLVNNQNIRKRLAQSMIDNPTSMFKHGGNIAEENYLMALNDGNTIKHHSQELHDALKKNKQIPAWVVAKLHQASTTLSDITHYLEGTSKSKFANGGNTPELAFKVGTPLKMKYSDDKYELVSFSDHGYTVAKKVNGELVEHNSFPYNIMDHGLFTKA